MPRIRTIKPTMWASEKLGSLSVVARLTFVGMISLADDAGRGRGAANYLWGQLHPYSPDVSVKSLSAALEELHAAGLACFYDLAGCRYYVLPGWSSHQKIDRPSDSEIPSIPKDKFDSFVEHSTSIRRTFDEHSSLDKEGKGEDRIGERSLAERSSTSPPPTVFPCVGKTKEWMLPPPKVVEWRVAYPGVDVPQEVRRALQWCRDNPSRRKTAAGMLAFLNRWLAKAQNDGRGTGKKIEELESLDEYLVQRGTNAAA